MGKEEDDCGIDMADVEVELDDWRLADVAKAPLEVMAADAPLMIRSLLRRVEHDQLLPAKTWVGRGTLRGSPLACTPSAHALNCAKAASS